MLSAHLERFSPDIVALNETWLDDSALRLDVPNYRCVSRRDRPGSKPGMLNHGGVAVYSRVGGILITHLEDSVIAERSWHTIHGPGWYIVWHVVPSARQPA